MVTSDEVKQIAKLAKLEIPEGQQADYADQMSRILKHFEDLKQVPTEEIRPLLHPNEQGMPFRDDQMLEPPAVHDWQKNAPDLVGALFKVPQAF